MGQQQILCNGVMRGSGSSHNFYLGCPRQAAVSPELVWSSWCQRDGVRVSRPITNHRGCIESNDQCLRALDAQGLRPTIPNHTHPRLADLLERLEIRGRVSPGRINQWVLSFAFRKTTCARNGDLIIQIPTTSPSTFIGRACVYTQQTGLIYPHRIFERK